MCHWNLDFVLGKCRFCGRRSAQERWQKVCVSQVHMEDIETVSRKPRVQNLTGCFRKSENEQCEHHRGFSGLIPEAQAQLRAPMYIVPDGPGGPGSELAEQEKNWKEWNYAKACVRCDPKFGESNWAHVIWPIMHHHFPKHIEDNVQLYLHEVPVPWESGDPRIATQESIQQQTDGYRFLRWNRALYIRHAIFSEQKEQWLRDRDLPFNNDLPDQPRWTEPPPAEPGMEMDQRGGDVADTA